MSNYLIRSYKNLIPVPLKIKIKNIKYHLADILFLSQLGFYKINQNINRKDPISENTTKNNNLFYLVPDINISGGVAVICEHANRLQQIGYKVTIIPLSNQTKLTWFPNQSVNIVPFENFKKSKIDCSILIATGWSTAYQAALIPANRKIYFVQSDESKFYPKGNYLQQRAKNTYKMDYEYMTEALWIKKWLKKEFGKEASLIPNGINTKIFYPTGPLQPKPKNKLRVLLEGPIDIPYKGMAESFAAVKNVDCEVWCISSSGKPKPDWKCDRFFEKVPITKMREIYSSCDVLLKMSTVEGFFGPPLEMMACGGVPIVAKVTGYDEYIKDGYNALVIKSGDIQGAKKALERLSQDKKLYHTLYSNGQQTVKNWSWDRSLALLKNILETSEYAK